MTYSFAPKISFYERGTHARRNSIDWEEERIQTRNKAGVLRFFGEKTYKPGRGVYFLNEYR